jgi:futalosine hydrolase
VTTAAVRFLVVTAVAAERDAVLAACPRAEVEVVGVGPAASAAATTAAILSRVTPPDIVLSAGIGGGFAPLGTGSIAVASASVFAELGIDTGSEFVPLSVAGFGTDRYEVAPHLAQELADRTGGRVGTIVTVATVTGTAARAEQLVVRYPDAVAEGMEGAGVAAAAAATGIRFAEIRAVSNAVGPRDTASWDIPGALAALGGAVAAVLTAESQE